MEDILKEIQEYKYYELSRKDLNRLQGLAKPGISVKIIWKDRSNPDLGYLFQIPECEDDIDMLDFIIHVPNPDNEDGMDCAPSVWVHLKNLMSNKRVKSINCL